MSSVTTTTALTIIGMRGNDCRERIAELLQAIEGVKDVDVSLHRGRAVIVHEVRCPSGDLVWALMVAGYGAALAPPRK